MLKIKTFRLKKIVGPILGAKDVRKMQKTDEEWAGYIYEVKTTCKWLFKLSIAKRRQIWGRAPAKPRPGL